eukprot:UN28266
MGQEYIFLTIGMVGAASDLVDQQFIECRDYREKKQALLGILKNKKGKKLVFCKTKRSADNLENDFYREHRISCCAIHGDKGQGARERALLQFRKGETTVMFATDVAQRGLDIPSVEYVVQFDLPENIDDYVHRIGRTGRAGNKGTAIALCDPGEKIVPDIVFNLKEAKKDVPDWMKRASSYGSYNRNNDRRDRRFGGRDYRSNYRDNNNSRDRRSRQ